MSDTFRHTLTLRPAKLDDLTLSSPKGSRSWNKFLVYFIKSQTTGAIEGPKYIREIQHSGQAQERMATLKAQFDAGMVYVACTQYELQVLGIEN
jgi:hypothetical protein